ncbi:mitochondrial import inner membrane translocase subunit tim21 [Neophaeococcomyces mojaviensis]|uniref:Mitochondrial import inner membrane translocase subunit tim21 n=1 Tax=Neophaeococcomyces mojaviensis TaxID=3383035 RepID=A0ACC3A1H4_9EURO|nr:mitochondrial import inner membrane translocase subunit tim21 [Knufia sp. JES_112]
MTAIASKARAFQQACRAHATPSHPSKRALIDTCQRSYATQSSLGSGPRSPNNNIKSSRRAITVTSDDGRYQWNELSTGEKAARTTQQSFNFLLVTAGAVGTVCVAYLLYQELFAADSKTRQFNRAVDRIKADSKCRELLGPANRIKAYGEPSTSKWARARPLAHTVDIDRFGTTHFRMHFHVEGPEASGVVNIHMTKKSDEDELQYRLLSLSVPGHETIYLENTDASSPKRALGKMFGVQWR